MSYSVTWRTLPNAVQRFRPVVRKRQLRRAVASPAERAGRRERHESAAHIEHACIGVVRAPAGCAGVVRVAGVQRAREYDVVLGRRAGGLVGGVGVVSVVRAADAAVAP